MNIIHHIIFKYFYYYISSYNLHIFLFYIIQKDYIIRMWFVHRISRTICFNGEILPTVECILRSGSEKITAVGWLPCHHSNIGYTLILQKKKEKKNRYQKKNQKKNIFNIVSILDIKCTKKKASLPKFRSREYEDYKNIANKSYTDVALWTIAVVYPFWTIKHMNIPNTFKRLTQDIENICKRGEPNAIHIYDKKNAKVAIENSLRQMGELPYDDWEGFEARMDWQNETRYNTASLTKPSTHVANVENYKDVWTTTDEIEKSKRIGQAMTPENTDIILGSPSKRCIPSGTVVIVRNLEDALRLHLDCQLDYHDINICMISLPFQLTEKCYELRRQGVHFVTTLPPNTQHVYIAWSHLWTLSDWLRLIEKRVCKYTLIGRLDQYNLGRGQIFRDMYESNRYKNKTVYHRMASSVIEERSDAKRSIRTIIDEIAHRHQSVQCFTDSHVKKHASIDTGRRCLYKPFRIRTKRFTSRCLSTNKNSSVVSIKSFNGVRCHACVFICSEKTTPFDIHVALSHARDVLYIINCTTCLFALKKISPRRITISPF